MQFGRKGYQHQVTKEQSKAHVDERGGGILADEMGLGKSLSIIALIIERAPEGRTWAGSSNMLTDTHGRIKAFSRATLVMVSSARKLHNLRTGHSHVVDLCANDILFHMQFSSMTGSRKFNGQYRWRFLESHKLRILQPFERPRPSLSRSVPRIPRQYQAGDAQRCGYCSYDI